MELSPLISLFAATAWSSWAILAYSCFQMTRNVRPDLPWSPDLLWDPRTLLCRAEILTVKGRRYRRRAAYALASCLAALAWGWILVAWGTGLR